MTRDEYERTRQRLEEQLQAEVTWLHEAHRIRLRALDALWSASPGLPEAGRPALPAAAGLLALPALPAAAPTPPPALPPPVKAKPWEVLKAVTEALGRVGEEFDKNELLALLAVKPQRATFYHALRELRYQGLIEPLPESRGRLTRYRKVARQAPASS